MPTMAKKKPKDQTADRHQSKKVLRIGDDVYEALSRMADDNDRPIVREARRIILKALEENGYWPPSEEDADNA